MGNTTSISLRNSEQGQRIKTMLLELATIYKIRGKKSVTQGDIVEEALMLLKQKLKGELPETTTSKIYKVLKKIVEYLEENAETEEDLDYLEDLKKQIEEIKKEKS